MTEEATNNMYIRNMNEAKRMELELKSIESGESETLNGGQEHYDKFSGIEEEEVQ